MENEVLRLQKELREERINMLALIEDMESVIEILSSELSLESPMRLQVEPFVHELRGAIEALRVRLSVSGQSE
jgi:hypothetical protein